MEIPTRSPPLDTGAHMFRSGLAGTPYLLTPMVTNFREAGRDVFVASSVAPSSSRYSLSHPFFLTSPWCVSLSCRAS